MINVRSRKRIVKQRDLSCKFSPDYFGLYFEFVGNPNVQGVCATSQIPDDMPRCRLAFDCVPAITVDWVSSTGVLHKELREKIMKIRKAVLPVAGLGTRFLPATKAQPKEMLPIVDKPLVQYAVEEVAAAGIPLTIFVTGRGKSAIENHFDVSAELEYELEGRGKGHLRKQVRSISALCNVVYLRQKHPKGLGHAVLMSRDLVDEEPFAVVLSDDVIDSRVPCLQQMAEVFNEFNASILAIERVPKRTVSSYGVIDAEPVRASKWEGRLFKVNDLVEKPSPADAPSNMAIIGRYILTPKIFKKLASTRRGKAGEVQLTDALKSLLSNEPIYGFLFEGKRYDAGDKLGFLKATVEYALKEPNIGGHFRKYLKSLNL